MGRHQNYNLSLFCLSLLSLMSFIGTCSARTTPSDDVLEWVHKDNHRFLQAIYRVVDFNQTIEFYTELFGMQLLKKYEDPRLKYSNALLGFGPAETHFVADITYYYGDDELDIGTGFDHFGVATPDVYKMVENIRAVGGNITREPAPLGSGGSTIFAFVKDPNGYSFELVQRNFTPEPFCQLLLHVADLNRSVAFYEKALGMKLLLHYDVPQENYTIAMVGYGDDMTQTAVIELKYNYNVTKYTKGNGYSQLAIGTDDVYKSAEAVFLVTRELGGMIVRPPGPVPGVSTKSFSFVDPDGYKTVLVDNKDYLKEIENKG